MSGGGIGRANSGLLLRGDDEVCPVGAIFAPDM